MVLAMTSAVSLACERPPREPAPQPTEQPSAPLNSLVSAPVAERADPDMEETGVTGSTNQWTETGDIDQRTTTAESGCPKRPPPQGASGAVGDRCEKDRECKSGICDFAADAPRGGGECAPEPAECSTRFLGRVLDVTTLKPVPNAELVVRDAMLGEDGELGAVGNADGDGRFDFLSSSEIVTKTDASMAAKVSAPGYATTWTYVIWRSHISDMYFPVNPIRDVWLVPEDTVETWNSELKKAETGIELGRDPATIVVLRGKSGAPIAGAKVVGGRGQDDTKVYYLKDDGSFGPPPTGQSGIAVLADKSWMEDFQAEVDGMKGQTFKHVRPIRQVLFAVGHVSPHAP